MCGGHQYIEVHIVVCVCSTCEQPAPMTALKNLSTASIQTARVRSACHPNRVEDSKAGAHGGEVESVRARRSPLAASTAACPRTQPPRPPALPRQPQQRRLDDTAAVATRRAHMAGACSRPAHSCSGGGQQAAAAVRGEQAAAAVRGVGAAHRQQRPASRSRQAASCSPCGRGGARGCVNVLCVRVCACLYLCAA